MKLTSKLLKEENTVFLLSIDKSHTNRKEYFTIENRTYGDDEDDKISVINECFEDGTESIFHDRWHIGNITPKYISIWKNFADTYIEHKLPLDRFKLVSIKPYVAPEEVKEDELVTEE